MNISQGQIFWWDFSCPSIKPVDPFLKRFKLTPDCFKRPNMKKFDSEQMHCYSCHKLKSKQLPHDKKKKKMAYNDRQF